MVNQAQGKKLISTSDNFSMKLTKIMLLGHKCIGTVSYNQTLLVKLSAKGKKCDFLICNYRWRTLHCTVWKRTGKQLELNSVCQHIFRPWCRLEPETWDKWALACPLHRQNQTPKMSISPLDKFFNHYLSFWSLL